MYQKFYHTLIYPLRTFDKDSQSRLRKLDFVKWSTLEFTIRYIPRHTNQLIDISRNLQSKKSVFARPEELFVCSLDWLLEMSYYVTNLLVISTHIDKIKRRKPGIKVDAQVPKIVPTDVTARLKVCLAKSATRVYWLWIKAADVNKKLMFICLIF